MSMNGGVMRSGQLTAAAGLGAPLVPFASLPAASTVEGQVRRLTELPHVSLIALGGIWRPFGGRQVLAQRTLNPVTVQALNPGQVAETIGPFPGGLERAGMRLEMQSRIAHPGVAGGSPIARLRVNGNYFRVATLSMSLAAKRTQMPGAIDVLSDTLAAHLGDVNGAITYASGFGSAYTPSVDFSAPWTADIFLTSAAETAVNIATATWVGGVATYNTSAVHTLAVGDKTTIAGVDLAGYNGVVIVDSIVDTDTFTVAMASDPGGSGTGGTSSRISNMISQSYVLELVG